MRPSTRAVVFITLLIHLSEGADSMKTQRRSIPLDKRLMLASRSMRGLDKEDIILFEKGLEETLSLRAAGCL